jgi:prepilin-type N-terminal cleavage/methylation domain-containing protein
MKKFSDLKKLNSHVMRPFPRLRPTTDGGFTLVELMIASTILVSIVGAMVAIQIFGLRVTALAATKLIATTSSRETLNSVRDQIRSSQQDYIGIYSNSTFIRITNGLPQIGNALQIFTTTNSSSTNFIVFYRDPSTNSIYSVDSAGNRDLLANYVTNYYCFQAEDYQGNILTNYQNNPVIAMAMSFSQWEFPVGYVGGNGVNAYDYYYLRTRIARRCKQ